MPLLTNYLSNQWTVLHLLHTNELYITVLHTYSTNQHA